MRNIYFSLLWVLLLATPLQAAEVSEVRSLLKGTVDAVVVLLQDKTIEKAHRNERITAILTPIFAYQTMARLSLGKKHWSALSQEKQAVFSDLFIRRLQQSYLNKLDLFSEEKVLYGEPLAKGKKVYMPTTLVAKDRNIEMLYKFYRSSRGWEIYDVEIGGVSVIQTYRSQFDGALSEGTIDDLLEKLRVDGAFVIPESGGEETRSGTG